MMSESNSPSASTPSQPPAPSRTWEDEEAEEEARQEAEQKLLQEAQARDRAQHEAEMKQKLDSGEYKWESLDHALEQVESLNRIVDDSKYPYKSKYQARVILTTLQTDYTTQLQQIEASAIVGKLMADASANSSDAPNPTPPADPNQIKELTESLGRIELMLGMNHAETEEISTGEKLLSKAVEKLKTSPIQYASELITGWNQLGVIWCNRAKHRRAYTHLRAAQMCYQTYKKQREALISTPSSTPSPLFSDTRWNSIESLHTMTLFYLAQVYNHLKKRDLSATYCHLTLNRQLKHGTYDKQDWATNAIGLGYYYTGQKQFQQAHHCLLAAQSMIDEKLIPTTKWGDDVELTKAHEIAANLCRAWGSFYLKRLLVSRDHLIDKLLDEADPDSVNVKEIKQRLENEKKQDAQRESDRTSADPMDDQDDDNKNQSSEIPLNIIVTFKTLNLKESPECKPADNFDQARDLFKEGLKWYTYASNYFILDGWVSDHIPIQQEISHLYKILAQFETDEARQTKMHKRRADLLEPILSQLSRAAYLEFYQQLSHEVAQIYSDMMEIKMKVNAQRSEGKEKTQATVKINELALKSIKHYEIWIKTFEKDGSPPKEMDPYYQKSYLTALFVVARLYSKIYSEEPNVYVTLLQKSLQAYQRCIALIHQYNAESLFETELSICQEMITLLPLKMEKIRITQKSFQE